MWKSEDALVTQMNEHRQSILENRRRPPLPNEEDLEALEAGFPVEIDGVGNYADLEELEEGILTVATELCHMVQARLRINNNDSLLHEPKASLFSVILPSTFEMNPLSMTHGPQEEDFFISRVLTRVIKSALVDGRIFGGASSEEEKEEAVYAVLPFGKEDADGNKGSATRRSSKTASDISDTSMATNDTDDL